MFFFLHAQLHPKMTSSSQVPSSEKFGAAMFQLQLDRLIKSGRRWLVGCAGSLGHIVLSCSQQSALLRKGFLNQSTHISKSLIFTGIYGQPTAIPTTPTWKEGVIQGLLNHHGLYLASFPFYIPLPTVPLFQVCFQMSFEKGPKTGEKIAAVSEKNMYACMYYIHKNCEPSCEIPSLIRCPRHPNTC